MDINAEARRILAVSISKLYASRTQRGGLRLHRSLLLSVVMRSARDIYHSSRGSEEACCAQPNEPMDTASSLEEPAGLSELSKPGLGSTKPPVEEKTDRDITEDKENMRPCRKRPGKASAAPDFLPSKRARLDPGEERYAALLGSCRTGAGESLTALSLNRVIPAC